MAELAGRTRRPQLSHKVHPRDLLLYSYREVWRYSEADKAGPGWATSGDGSRISILTANVITFLEQKNCREKLVVRLLDLILSLAEQLVVMWR